MDFKLQMGILLAIIGVHLSIFFISVLPQVILCLGWCKCWAFFFLVISICTVFFVLGGGLE